MKEGVPPVLMMIHPPDRLFPQMDLCFFCCFLLYGNRVLGLSCIEAAVCLFLSRHGGVADTFQVANDAGHIVYIRTAAFGAFVQVTLVDMTTVVTDRVRDVESEVVASFLGCHTEQLAVLSL